MSGPDITTTLKEKDDELTPPTMLDFIKAESKTTKVDRTKGECIILKKRNSLTHPLILHFHFLAS